MTFIEVLEEGPKRNEVDEGCRLILSLYFVFNSFLFGIRAVFRKVTIRKVRKTRVPRCRASKVTNSRVEGDGRSEHRWSQKCRWTVTNSTVKKGLRSHFGR